MIEADLVDELRLMVFPVLVGGGKSLFPASYRKATFTLAGSEPVRPDVVALTYSRAA